MPIYEFNCRDCRSNFEKLIPASGRDSVLCPECNSQRTVRHISLTAPAQVAGGGSRSAPPESCGAPNCCGGMCGMPEFN